MVFWFTSCLILITNLGRKRSWDSTFLLVSTVHVPVKCKLSFCFSTSAVEYEAKMPRYFSYELQLVHQSSMIPMYYMWTPITVHCLCSMCRRLSNTVKYHLGHSIQIPLLWSIFSQDGIHCTVYYFKCLIEWQVIWHHFTNTKKPSSDLMDTLPLVLNEMKKNQRLNQINKREPLKNQS